jgi:hypothetical protein
MRRRAQMEEWSGPGPQPEYVAGHAEATGLPEGIAAAVLAAQAFHWFEPEAALREFQRILRPRGWTALMWNERDETDPCTAAFGAVVGGTPEAIACEAPRRRAGEVLLTCSLFEDGRRDVFSVEQTLSEEGLVDRALSASYAPRKPLERVARFRGDLRAVFRRFQQHGYVFLRYETSVYTARRRHL